MFPNLARIADSGFVERVVTNAQSTQFVLPSIFSLTYPLDYGGYDTGIRLRPQSFVETLKENNWTTHKLETMNQLGKALGYDRGFDTVRATTDFRVALETFLDRTLSYQVNLWKMGELSEAEAVEVSASSGSSWKISTRFGRNSIIPCGLRPSTNPTNGS